MSPYLEHVELKKEKHIYNPLGGRFHELPKNMNWSFGVSSCPPQLYGWTLVQAFETSNHQPFQSYKKSVKLNSSTFRFFSGAKTSPVEQRPPNSIFFFSQPWQFKGMPTPPRNQQPSLKDQTLHFLGGWWPCTWYPYIPKSFGASLYSSWRVQVMMGVEMLFAALMISCLLSCCLNKAEWPKQRNNVERTACFTNHVPTKLRKYTYKI